MCRSAFQDRSLIVRPDTGTSASRFVHATESLRTPGHCESLLSRQRQARLRGIELDAAAWFGPGVRMRRLVWLVWLVRQVDLSGLYFPADGYLVSARHLGLQEPQTPHWYHRHCGHCGVEVSLLATEAWQFQQTLLYTRFVGAGSGVPVRNSSRNAS